MKIPASTRYPPTLLLDDRQSRQMWQPNRLQLVAVLLSSFLSPTLAMEQQQICPDAVHRTLSRYRQTETLCDLDPVDMAAQVVYLLAVKKEAVDHLCFHRTDHLDAPIGR